MGEKIVYCLELSQEAMPRLGNGQVLTLPVPHHPYTLRIVIPGSSPVLNTACSLKCNFPAIGMNFYRKVFQEFKLDHRLTGNAIVDIEISHSGAFEVKIGDSVHWNFVVNNGFELDGQKLSADSLCVQTLLSKLVSPSESIRSERWTSILENIAGKGYNMIHFVPLQKRGESDSPFSIADQLEWDATTFPKGELDVSVLTDQLKRLNILGLSDIVLNHTASNSDWLSDHLDAGYSPDTAPHLQSAMELDTELLKLGSEEQIEIKDTEDLKRVVTKAVKDAAETVKLWEFYVVDVESLQQAVEKHPYHGTPSSDLPDNANQLAQQLIEASSKRFDCLGPRHARSVDSTLLAEYVAGSGISATNLLNEVNVQLYKEYNDDLEAATASIIDRQRYLRLDSNGPQIGSIVTKDAPIIETYFNRRFGKPLACNGWIWAGNPLIDHAGPQSKAYIRRELIVWEDCIKLRYGDKPQDSPYLWDRMGRYARMLARHFAGLRIDNCHSTPLHVGEYILDEARRVRPNLYVVAELFSGSQEMDKLYVERLGIGSLLREAIMAGSPQDLSTIVHSNGGDAIGSFVRSEVTGSTAHSWLMEVTHDNETLAEKRTVEDTLPTAGLVAMCQVASGSTYGNDECYPTALNVVSETRPYTLGGGITEAKAELNRLHSKMACSGMSESYTDCQGQYITVHRINPETGEGIFLVARTKFGNNDDPNQQIDTTFLEASKAEWIAGWSLFKVGHAHCSDDTIVPIQTRLDNLIPNEPEFDGKSSTIKISTGSFPQGSIALWRTSRTFKADHIEKLVKDKESAKEAVKNLDLLDLNLLLYRAEGEERACTDNLIGVYDVPGLGPLVYAGLQGWISHLTDIVAHQNLGHPLCVNLRDGLWAFEYILNRIPFEPVKAWLEERLEATREVPTFLRPRYFASTILCLYYAATDKALELMHLDPSITSQFYRKLILTSVQMVNLLPNCSLSPNKQLPTMAAGLPHFSEGIMRCWGRDVFLSAGGLLIRTGRLEEAKQHILGFGATLKYGLIPNLLSSGTEPRYNARDAAWFFVECIQDYCKSTNSLELLNEKVQRRFPFDDSYTEKAPGNLESSVGDLVFEVLARHAKGINFREHNAGSELDMHMKDNGFNQHIWTDWTTGIVFGGNQDNCGTWQDKMGESLKAGSEGIPGTPRDGAAIEITALLKSCLRWLNKLRNEGMYNWPNSVENQYGDQVDLNHWESLIQQNFEKCYYIPLSEDAEDYDVDWKIVNRRGIYKDCYRSGKPYEDYQMRSNFTIAIIVAPELFDVEKVTKALDLADEVLRGPVGMATLDPEDMNYRPYYVNSEDSTDFATSKGRNYHQGPEWVWLYGTFLQAYIQTCKRRGEDTKAILAATRDRIKGHVRFIAESPWAGLTELTQKNGEICEDSSPTQAWSSARLIEALHDAMVVTSTEGH